MPTKVEIPTKAKPNAKAVRPLTETTSIASPSSLDREAGVIFGVKVLGARSKNGRVYTPSALASSVPLLEGSRVNVNHSSRKELVDPERRLGKLRNARLQGDGVYADLHYLKSHPLSERLCEAAESNPDLFGLSINADGETSQDESSGGVLVTRIVAVKSVDLVSDPATVSSLFESQESPMDSPLALDPEPTSTPDPTSPRETLESLFLDQIAEIAKDSGKPIPDRAQEIKKILQAWEDAQSALEDAVADDASTQEAQEALRPVQPPTGTRMVLEAMAEKGVPVPSEPRKAQALLESLAKLPGKEDVLALLEAAVPAKSAPPFNRPRTAHSSPLDPNQDPAKPRIRVDMKDNGAVSDFLRGR